MRFWLTFLMALTVGWSVQAQELFPLQVVPTIPPPAQAAAAGYTTLAYDFEPAAMTNIPSWFDCANTGTNAYQMFTIDIPPLAKFSCANNLSVATDPVTGKLTWVYTHHADTDPPPATEGSACNNTCWPGADQFATTTPAYMQSSLPAHGTFPAGAYIEVRYRDSTVMTDNGMNGVYNPAYGFFTFYNIPYGGPTGHEATLERDIGEDYGGRGGDMVAHDWFDCQYTNLGACFGNYALVSSPSSLNPPDTDTSHVHTYGWLSTTDGVSKIQSCGYVDDVRVQEAVPGDIKNCSIVDYAPQTSPCTIAMNSGTWPAGACAADRSINTTDQYGSPVVTRFWLNHWFGSTYGPDTWACQYYGTNANGPYNPTTNPSPCTLEGGEPDFDTQIEFVRVWTCAGWVTDNTCLANGITPKAIVNVQLNGSNQASFPTPTTAGQLIGTLTATCISGTTEAPCTGTTFSLGSNVAGAGDCLGSQITTNFQVDNARFTISGNQLLATGGLTAGAGGLPNHLYGVCVRVTSPDGNTYQASPLFLTGA